MTMETRAILAAVLMVGLLILYQALFLPAPAPEAPPPGEQKAEEAAPAAGQAAARKLPEVAVAPPPAMPAPAEARSVVVDGPLFRGAVGEDGGRIHEWTIKYRGEKALTGDRVRSLGVVVAPPAGEPKLVPMRFADDRVVLDSEGAEDELQLRGEVGGLEVSKTLRFDADSYMLDVAVRLVNRGREPSTVTVALPWEAPQAWMGEREAFPGQHPIEVVWADGGVHRVVNLCEAPSFVGDGAWIGLGTSSYLTALVPRAGGFRLAASAEGKQVCEAKSAEPVGRATVALQAAPTIAPGEAWEGRASIYIGPKEYERLKAYGLEGAINWGCFPIWCEWGGLPMQWLGVPILKVMNWLYGYVANYGVAIILLTVLIRVLFYPLTVKSMRSMKAMQSLQPQVNALRNKYRNDPRKLQEETMALYRKHKVNPMGGCLPMVAQIPIFYALYVVLTVSAELQSAPFVCFGRMPEWVPWLGGQNLWICDLGAIDPTYLLPVLMAVTMFIQQKMTPTAADPQQARMMMLMPLMFGGMFIVFPIASGLTLYWTVSNILQIAQQWLMDRGSRRAQGGKPAKSRA